MDGALMELTLTVHSWFASDSSAFCAFEKRFGPESVQGSREAVGNALIPQSMQVDYDFHYLCARYSSRFQTKRTPESLKKVHMPQFD
jgi:hypothetical protein